MAHIWEDISEGKRYDFCLLKMDIAQHSQISRANRQADVVGEKGIYANGDVRSAYDAVRHPALRSKASAHAASLGARGRGGSAL